MENNKDEELLIYEIPKFDDDKRVSAEISKKAKPKQAKQAIKTEDKYSTCGIVVTLIFAISGVAALFLGITGKVNLSAELKGFKLTLLNCSPGVLLVILSIVVYFISKPKIKIK